MSKGDWTEGDNWEDLATDAGWWSPDAVLERIDDERAEAVAGLKEEAFAVVIEEFERLAALDRIPRTLAALIVQTIRNEERYGRV